MALHFVRCPPRGRGRPWGGPAAGQPMLSRTADHLFWMARYMERAENTARMLDVNYQMSLLPQSVEAAEKGWKGLLSISELSGDYAKRHGAVSPRGVMNYMVSDPANG